MAKHGVFRNGFIEVAGVDMSDHCLEFELQINAEELPAHCHGDHVNNVVPGLFNWSVRGRFLQDFAATTSGTDKAIDKTFWDNLSGRIAVPVRVRADQGTVSTTNPMYSGMAYIMSSPPMGGAHGALLVTEVMMKPATGNTMLSRLTS